MTPEWVAYALLGFGLIAYALTAGADFGGGVLDLWARGPTAEAQRTSIQQAIAPIWEVNHIWLIFMIVVLFTAFPTAFAALSTALHIPITLALIGIVLRGSAFVFRAYGLGIGSGLWQRVFGISSLFTPVFLGMTLGAIATGEIRVGPSGVTTGFMAGWTSLFSVSVGVFVLVLFTMLASVYLTLETDGALQEVFRSKALVLEVLASVTGGISYLLADRGAEQVHQRLSETGVGVGLLSMAISTAVLTVACLMTGKFGWARWMVGAQVACIILGFGWSLDGHLLIPDLEVSAVPPAKEVLTVFFGVMVGGAILTTPALVALFRVFRRFRL